MINLSISSTGSWPRPTPTRTASSPSKSSRRPSANSTSNRRWHSSGSNSLTLPKGTFKWNVTFLPYFRSSLHHVTFGNIYPYFMLYVTFFAYSRSKFTHVTFGNTKLYPLRHFTYFAEFRPPLPGEIWWHFSSIHPPCDIFGWF